MLGILPRGHVRDTQETVKVLPEWANYGLNSALVAFGTDLIEVYDPARIRGSGGVRTSTVTQKGKAVRRTSGNYDFTNLCQTQTFSRIAVIRQAATGETVISGSRNTSANFGSNFSTQSGQILLISSDQALIATSTGAGLVTGKTSVIGVTYSEATGTGVTTFFCDGRFCGSTTGNATFINDGTGRMLVNGGGNNPFTGDLSLHLDFNKPLNDTQMLALTRNPYQIFAPSHDLWLEAPAGGPVTHDTSGALTGQGSTIAGTAAHIAIHGTSGALTGQGSSVVGSARRFRNHPTSGVLIGQGAIVAGDASRSNGATTHDTTGILTGQGSVIAGVAARFRLHATTGVLAGQGALITGDAARVAAPVSHATSGVLTGQGAILSGSAQNGAAVQNTGAGSGTIDWQEPRRKLRLKEKPLQHLEFVLKNVVAEVFGDLTKPEIPKKVKLEAKKIVKAYEIEDFAPEGILSEHVPPPIDFEALSSDSARLQQLMNLWQQEVENKRRLFNEIEEANIEFLLLMN